MADLETLLLRTSRTFALSIPQLPAPLREQVTLAYLLFRVADTLEDADRWDRARRLEALARFGAVLRGEASVAEATAAWLREPPCDHPGYLELVGAFPEVLAACDRLAPAARAAIVTHTLRTAAGMEGFVAQGGDDGSLRLPDLPALRRYCYVVAGIVGELLCELFLLAEPLERAAATLRETAVAFGEGLQLVNILKDAADDAANGRVYLPPTVERAAIFALARADLEAARRYVAALQEAGASAGVVAFCALPVRLALATLERVEARGPGAKVDRATVLEEVARMAEAIERGAAAC